MNNPSLTFNGSLDAWLARHSIGRKPATQKFNREVAATVRKHWPAPDKDCEQISAADVLAFGQAVAHYSAARWNAMVSAIRFITPHGRLLDFRAVQLRVFTPPEQGQFNLFLVECDRDPRSTAGLVVRFLSLTGLRIAEARALRWADVREDRIDVRAATAKRDKARAVPVLPGLAEVLARLRELAGVSEFVLPRESARKAIRSACARAGVAGMSFHCFRHYFATRCIESGVDVPTVARWLGHRDGGALLGKTYFHLLDDHSRRMAAKVRLELPLAA
jgi:integrase